MSVVRDNTSVIDNDNTGATAVVREDSEGDKIDNRKDDVNIKNENDFFYYSNRFSTKSWMKKIYFLIILINYHIVRVCYICVTSKNDKFIISQDNIKRMMNYHFTHKNI